MLLPQDLVLPSLQLPATPFHRSPWAGTDSCLSVCLRQTARGNPAGSQPSWGGKEHGGSSPFSRPQAGSCALAQEVTHNHETRERRVPLFDSHPYLKSPHFFLLRTADLCSVTGRTLKALMFAEADKPESAASLLSSGASLPRSTKWPR